MKFNLGIPEISLFVVLQVLVWLWLSERFKASLQKENTKFAEQIKWDFKIKEQASKVAEYMAMARLLREDSPEADYINANKLTWELAILLPEDIYKHMVAAIVQTDYKNINELTVIAEVRKYLLDEKAGNLTMNDIAHHAPGIGKK